MRVKTKVKAGKGKPWWKQSSNHKIIKKGNTKMRVKTQIRAGAKGGKGGGGGGGKKNTDSGLTMTIS